MTSMLILCLALLAFCVFCAAMVLHGNKRIAEMEQASQAALNTAEEMIQGELDKINTLRTALGGLNKTMTDLRKENRDLKDELEKVKALIPEDVKEERLRRDVLMRQLNDELETRIQAEKEWNGMVASVLGYDLGKAIAAGVNSNGE